MKTNREEARGSNHEEFGGQTSDRILGRHQGGYDKVDREDGLSAPGTRVREGDVVVMKTAPGPKGAPAGPAPPAPAAAATSPPSSRRVTTASSTPSAAPSTRPTTSSSSCGPGARAYLKLGINLQVRPVYPTTL